MGILTKNLLWSMALYRKDIFDKNLGKEVITFNNKKIRTSKKHLHTCADPFLFVENDSLYMFYESQIVGEVGEISVIITRDLKDFKEVRGLLKEDFHLSYPFVFRQTSSIFMIPESAEANGVILYKFSDFPTKIERCKTLLTGFYVDTSVISHNGTWYLFTTSKLGLEIYFTDDIENTKLVPHPNNPISSDPRYQRNGGGPVLIENNLYRIAQDCSTAYGSNLNILKIKNLSKNHYEEEIFVENYFDCDLTINKKGGHHLSIAKFKGESMIAIDGKHEDYLLNKFISPIFKLMNN